MEKNLTVSSTPIATIRLAVLFAGPLASWMLAQARLTDVLAPGDLNFVAMTLALVWSPLFFSVPALLMQRERDRLVPAPGGPVASLVRGVRLVPAMLREDSGIRTETAASLVGWAALLVAAGPYLAAGISAVL